MFEYKAYVGLDVHKETIAVAIAMSKGRVDGNSQCRCRQVDPYQCS